MFLWSDLCQEMVCDLIVGTFSTYIVLNRFYLNDTHVSVISKSGQLHPLAFRFKNSIFVGMQ